MENSDPIDKSWIDLNIRSQKYMESIEFFLDYAITHSHNKLFIPCPCKTCENLGDAESIDTVRLHCYKNGFDEKYVRWIYHGETKDKEKNQPSYEEVGGNVDQPEMAWNTIAEELSGDVNIMDMILEETHRVGVEGGPTTLDNDPMLFNDNLQEAMCALYPNCENFTILRFILRLFKNKVKSGWSDASVTELLELLKLALPKGNDLPTSTYRAEKLVKQLGFNYQKIDSCPKDCILYFNENKHLQSCPTCTASRYIIQTIDERKNHVRQPAKQLRYFPITERLKRMYSVKWVAEAMLWHSTNRLGDGELGHPIDSSSWKFFDLKYPNFSLDPHNVRLGLATDGFNPFGMQSTSYSSWPVMCVTYNLPPWLCMKPQFIMLALLIEGPQQPGKDIDIYFQPLVEELLSLWRISFYVKYANTGNMFNMRAILLWTIHDYPAYGDISGCKTKGRYGCVCCGPNTSSIWLDYGSKTVYMDHRCFLGMTDPRRKDVRESTFNKKEELRPQPKRLSGVEIFNLTKDLNVEWGKKKKRKGKGVAREANDGDNNNSCFCKQSIFFKLDYWQHLPICHNLDVMHIEKNVCETLLALMLDTKGKTKDNINTRKDLKRLGLKKKYWLIESNMKKRGPLCLRPDEKKIFLATLRDLSIPIGFSSNWKNIVSEGAVDLKGMKSHDYHILMQHLLPVLIQHTYIER